MNKEENLFITGIGTGVGKTVVSAVFVQHFQADYWKPIQSGDLDDSDTQKVQQLVDGAGIQFHPERHRLQLAASPHKSAIQENIQIQKQDFNLPVTANRLIIEGAGGLLVPISDDFFMIDLIIDLEAAVVLVVRDYLGCINHSLLSIAFLRQKKIAIAYLVINGTMDVDSERVILKAVDSATQIVRIPEFSELNKTIIQTYKLA
ncbi:dethiobiotin synthase [Flavobacterium sp. HSC-61S13]|uniref:dethiobiotin synthase n=1 Tax=Flavobacterium sp. HSC-61S13 TaxID=2910963 RepID=UPI00209FEFFC|nr:dethiobiotin synthase [Flavobacterium sp. HSC-61S13]MCP1996802.1 dethiobiotin synthetase [Flavobacterium sp. HSC-61S13]